MGTFTAACLVVYSDASDHACSSFIDNAHKIFYQNWSPAESSQSSTWKELRTWKLLGLLTTLVWSASIVDNGSKITKLQSLALSVFNVCVQPSILTITCTMHDDVFRMLDLIVNGDPTQWTGLPAAITPRFRVSFLGFTSLARKL